MLAMRRGKENIGRHWQRAEAGTPAKDAAALTPQMPTLKAQGTLKFPPREEPEEAIAPALRPLEVRRTVRMQQPKILPRTQRYPCFQVCSPSQESTIL